MRFARVAGISAGRTPGVLAGALEHGMRRQPSQALWTEAEALERAGEQGKAMDLYVRAASAEEDAGRPLRARVLWEQIAQRVGASGLVLERLANVCGRSHMREESFDYWVAAAARYHADGKAEDAARARSHAQSLKTRGIPAHEPPAIAAEAIRKGEEFVRDLL